MIAGRRKEDAKGLVPLDQVLCCPLQRALVEFSPQIERDGLVEGAGRRGPQLGAEPNFHLAFRKLKRARWRRIWFCEKASRSHFGRGVAERIYDLCKVLAAVGSREEEGESLMNMQALRAQKIPEELRGMTLGRKFEIKNRA